MQIISNVQKRILVLFGDVSDSGSFYLTGGTALAEFYLKHRKSNDLDFFAVIEEIIIPFSYNLEQALKKDGMVVERQRAVRSFVELRASQQGESTIIHIAQDTPFRFEELKEFPLYPNLKVDNLTDIASNKLLALFGRAALRDFIDIYFLIKKGFFTFEALIEKAKLKDPGFDLYWLAVAFERIRAFNGDAPDLLMVAEKVDFRDLLDFFDLRRKEIADKLR